MKIPQIPISWGELFDKITILQIKLENLQSKSALKNVKLEHDQLCKIYDSNFLEHENARRLMHDLKKINQKLWDIEDKIRDKERSKIFDQEFIELARKVYFTNDERSRIKRNINEIFGSELIEEKSYAHY
mgnify:CR=1 FL=1|tara:strand:+ start:137 stop:526 length:390 start_codon:yes stop_codon:yes gene_type:complete